MEYKYLNTKLLEAFPELKDAFEDEASWQEGINTGCTVVYEDVYMPYVKEAITKKDETIIARIFDFIESLTLIDDEYSKQLLMICIFDNLVFFDDEIDYKKWFRPKSLDLFNKSRDE